jgi:hypothetical protein
LAAVDHVFSGGKKDGSYNPHETASR